MTVAGDEGWRRPILSNRSLPSLSLGASSPPPPRPSLSPAPLLPFASAPGPSPRPLPALGQAVTSPAWLGRVCCLTEGGRCLRSNRRPGGPCAAHTVPFCSPGARGQFFSRVQNVAAGRSKRGLRTGLMCKTSCQIIEDK